MWVNSYVIVCGNDFGQPTRRVVDPVPLGTMYVTGPFSFGFTSTLAVALGRESITATRHAPAKQRHIAEDHLAGVR